MQPLDIQYHASGPNSQVSLSEAFFATWCVVHKGGIASILQGLMATKSNQHNAMVVDELWEQLSKRVSMVQQNLAAVNLTALPGPQHSRVQCMEGLLGPLPAQDPS